MKKILIFGIPLPSKYDQFPLNKRINEFIKSILKYNKSSFYFKRKIKVNKYKEEIFILENNFSLKKLIFILFSVYYTLYK